MQKIRITRDFSSTAIGNVSVGDIREVEEWLADHFIEHGLAAAVALKNIVVEAPAPQAEDAAEVDESLAPQETEEEKKAKDEPSDTADAAPAEAPAEEKKESPDAPILSPRPRGGRPRNTVRSDATKKDGN